MLEKSSTRTQIHARIPQVLVDQMDANAALLGVDRSAVIQAAIAKYLEQPEQIPIQLRYADLERRIYDLELIVRSSPSMKSKSQPK
jgi:hypothetical protein